MASPGRSRFGSPREGRKFSACLFGKVADNKIIKICIVIRTFGPCLEGPLIANLLVFFENYIFLRNVKNLKVCKSRMGIWMPGASGGVPWRVPDGRVLGAGAKVEGFLYVFLKKLQQQNIQNLY